MHLVELLFQVENEKVQAKPLLPLDIYPEDGQVHFVQKDHGRKEYQ